MNWLPKSLLARFLWPVLTLMTLAAVSAYILIERIVVHEIHLKAEEGLRAEGERIMGRLRSDYALLFHAFGQEPDRFARMSEIAQKESLGYLERFGNAQGGIKIYLKAGGSLLLPRDEQARAQAGRLFGPAPCGPGDSGCLTHTLRFAPWDWEMVLYRAQNDFLSDARQTLLILMAVIAVMALLIAFTIALALKRQVHRPLGQVLEHLDGIGRGEYLPLPPGGSLEMDRLMRHLVRMGEQIRRREEELRQSQESYRLLSTRLEERVHEETQRRAGEHKVLLQHSRVAAMGEMIGAIAHHWRQPLNALALTVQDIRDAWQHGELDDRYLDENVTRSMKQIGDLSRTIDSFRSFFKPDNQAERFDPAEAIAQAIELLGAEMAHHRIEIGFDPPERPFLLTGYPAQLKQVLVNLLINAKDAIVLRNVENGRIRIELQPGISSVRLRVCDNGGGIEAGVMEHIFDPFFSTKEAGKGSGVISGSGVGLYMSKLIIEEHFKGRIDAYNEGGGACFVLTVALGQDSTKHA
ncbi:MAG: sensor histidine kinase [Campylobacterales bacterium]